MIAEAIDFIDIYEAVEGGSESKEWRIDNISDKYEKICIINASIQNESLKIEDNPVFLTSDLDKNLKELGFKDLEKWLNKNAENDLLDRLDFNKYINAISETNKCIGTRRGLLSFSLFHFRLRQSWFSDGKFEKAKKIEKFKFSNEFTNSLKKDLENNDNENILKSINILNSENGVRYVYNNLIKRIESKAENPGKHFGNMYIYLNLQNNSELVDKLFKNFISHYVFITRDTVTTGNCPICDEKNKIIGTPQPYNILNLDKKPFIKHLTQPNPYNIKLCGDCTLKFNNFERYIEDSNTDFIPLFINEEELNEEVKYLKNNNDQSFFDILEYIFNKVAKKDGINNKNNLDFILFHYNKTESGKKDILYYDYVTNYSIDLGKPKDYLSDGIDIKSMKDLRSELIYNILNIDDTYFFGEIDFPISFNQTKKYLIHKYRNKLFNLIYRNEFSLKDKDIREIIGLLIDDRIKSREAKDSDDRRSKDMLDIYLNSDLFIENPGEIVKKVGNNEKNMLDSIREERDDIIGGEPPDITSDEEFGYYLGQTVYYLIEQSEAANKMRLIKPVIESNSKESLQRVLTEKYFDKYAHELSNYKDFKHNIFAETLDYLQSDFNSNFDKIKVPFYIGFFDDNILFTSTKNGDKNE